MTTDYWTDKYFGSLYHEIYSQHLLDPQRALEEAAFAAQVLDLGRRTVLDVACGYGRHARLLAQSNKVIAIDRTAEYVQAARIDLPSRAQKHLLAVQADMRRIPLPDRAVDATVMLFNSFGYFGADADALENSPGEPAVKQQVWKLPSVFYERQLVDNSFGRFKDPKSADNSDASENESKKHEEPSQPGFDPVSDPNIEVLREILRVLKPGGGLLLEIPNRRLLLEAVEVNPRRLMVVGDYEVHEQFEWDPRHQRLKNRTRFVSGDREEAAGYSMRLYDPAEIKTMLQAAGFRVKRSYGDYDASRFGPASSDILLIHAARPARQSPKKSTR